MMKRSAQQQATNNNKNSIHEDVRQMGAIYKWEQNLQRSWEVVTEDKEGKIHVEKPTNSEAKLRKRDQDRLSCIRRGLIRYTV